MSTAVALMDRDDWDANTDVIVVARPRRRELLWVPRDLWSRRYARRINGAFELGGWKALLAALREVGVRARHAVCVRRGLCEAVLGQVDVTVPVERPVRYWYPLAPQSRIEDGRREVSFEPPSERLTGDRVHEWLGARYDVSGFSGGDIGRMARQQVFLRELLRTDFPLGDAILARREELDVSGPRALVELRAVRSDWRMRTMGGWLPAKVGGREVLVRRRFRRAIPDLAP